MKPKRYFFLLCFFIAISFLSACFEGYISSSEAEELKAFYEPESLKALTENPRDSIWIIDVRPADDYNNGHIPTAKSFPSSEIMKQTRKIPKSKYLILYCETGGRAQSVIKNLEDKGYKRMMNWGSYKRWPYDYETK